MPYTTGPGVMEQNWETQGPVMVPGQNYHQAGQPTPAMRSVQRQPQQISTPVQARSAAMTRQVPQGGMMMRR